MQKYIEMMNIPNWLPFIGMMAGKSPLATRFVEAGILAFIPIIVMSIWAIPKLETKVEAILATQSAVMTAYSNNMKSLSDEVKESNQAAGRMQTSIAVLENNMARIEQTVNSTNGIANTKVRTVEGRLDALEHRLK